MKVKIHRGTKEIGGTCVELTANNGKVLWVDLGEPLDNKNANIDYTRDNPDALLISHPHQDHFGLIEKIGKQVPVYIGHLSLDLINATRIFRSLLPLDNDIRFFDSWKSFTVEGTFVVMPFLNDHSTPETFSFVIEADGKKIFYSGDFRATGSKSKLFINQIHNPPSNIDLLLMEGTMIARSNHLYPSEKSVESAIYNIIVNQKNITFVVSSAQNSDRFKSVYNACKKAGKCIVTDAYSAWVLDKVNKLSKSTPVIGWNGIKVFDHPGQLEKLSDASFDVFRSRISKHKIGNSIFATPAEYVYFVRCPNVKLVNSLRKHGIINIIYSQWEGYLKEEHKNYCTDYLNDLRNDSGISFHLIHTSGHSALPDLITLAISINPKKIVPIHTAFPEAFKSEFESDGFTNVDLGMIIKNINLIIKQWKNLKEASLMNLLQI